MNVTILGCGRWASFHAWYQAEVLKNNVLVWGLEDETFKQISTTRRNEFITLPSSVEFTTDLKKAIDFAEYILIVISAQAMPEFSKRIGDLKPMGKTFVLCMKGIIHTTGERLSEVLLKNIGDSNKAAVWVGPGHTQEFAQGIPNVMLIASSDEKTTYRIVEKFKSKLVRLYRGEDLLGAEIGAAAKNVLGIMAGILDASGQYCLKGALMARGAFEVSNLIVAMGGQQLTAYGISHLGDYESTLFSKHSSNRNFGEMFYRGEKTEFLAEGVDTSKALNYLAKKYKVDMPICRLCYEILHKGKDMKSGMRELFERKDGKEFKF